MGGRLRARLFGRLAALFIAVGGGFVAPVGAAGAAQTPCVVPSDAVQDAILDVASDFLQRNYADVSGSIEVRRVEGDWALVYVVPDARLAPAYLMLIRNPGGAWSIAWGPNESLDEPPSGMPASLTTPCG